MKNRFTTSLLRSMRTGKMWKKLLIKKILTLLIIMFLWAGSSWGQSVIIGTGTTTTDGNKADPVERYYDYEHFQIVYLASELIFGGMSSGSLITALGFSISESAVSLSNYEISIGHTTQALADPYIPTAGMNIVKPAFTYNPVVQTAGNFDMITFDNNFSWNGTDNIVIDICTGSNPFTVPYGGLRYTASTFGAIKGVRTDGTSNCATATSGNYTYRPNIRLDYTGGTACSGTPAPGNTLVTANPICSGVNFTLLLQNPTSGSGVTYAWESSPDNSTWTPITGAVSPAYTTSQTVVTWYRCQVTCAGNTGISTPVQVTMVAVADCYCTSTATNDLDEEILNVTLASLNNTSTCATTGGPGSVLNKYSNYRSPVLPATDLQQGSINAFSVQVGTCGGNYGSAIKIFIDFNQDADFADPGEEVFVSASSVSGPHIVTGSIAVPVGATLGNTVMRVVNVETSMPSAIVACGTYAYGETEDYTVNIIPSAGCPAPISLTATGITFASALLDWTEVGTATSWEIEWGEFGYVTGTRVVTGSHPYTLNPPLTPSTTYSFKVRAICGVGDTSSWSATYNFTTLCNAFTTLPHTEGFEKYIVPDCWTSSLISGTYQWVDTANMLTEVPSPHSGLRCAAKYFGSSVALLTSPQFNISGVTGNMEMKIWVYRGQYAHASDSTTFFANTAPSHIGATRLGMIPRKMSTAPVETTEGWYEYTFTVPSAFNGVPFHVLIQGNTAGGVSSYSLGVDDFTLQLPVICAVPTNLTASVSNDSVTFNCTSPATAFQIELGPAGFVIGTGYRFDVLMPIMATGVPDGCYDTYVRAICGPGDTSAWSLPVSYCVCTGIYSPPYFEGFEGTAFPPLCWSQTITNATYTWYQNAATFYEGTQSALCEYDPAPAPQDEWLISPKFDLTGITHAQAKFAWNGSKYWSMYPYNNCDLNLMAKVGNGSWVKIWDQFDTDTATYASFTWRLDSVDISSFAGDTVRFAFQYVGVDGADFFVDAFTIEEISFMDLTVSMTDVEECDTIGWFAPPIGIVNVGSDTVPSGAVTQISYSADGITFTVDNYTFTADLLPGDYVMANFTTPYHFNQFTTYNATMAVTYPGDMNIMNDTVHFTITFEHPPVVNLGNDTSICDGASLLLDAGGIPGDTYLWNTSEVSKTITVTTASIYGVVVTSSTGCIGHDSIVVSVTALPVPVITGNATACEGSSVVYSTASGMANYVWGVTGGTITTGGSSTDDYAIVMWSSAGAGSVTVNYEENGCAASTPTTKTVNVYAYPVVNLGHDSTICNDQTIVLDAGNPGATYSWWNGSTGQQHPIDVSYCTPNSTCLYWVDVTVSGCTKRDSINITFDPCTGIDENGNTSVSLYPNPTNGYITIEFDGLTGKVLLSIHSLHGQIVYSEEFENVTGLMQKQLDLSTLSRGVYMIKIQNSGSHIIKKLIIE